MVLLVANIKQNKIYFGFGSDVKVGGTDHRTGITKAAIPVKPATPDEKFLNEPFKYAGGS